MQPTVTVVGGGLGGLIAAVAAREAGFDVQLFESRAQLGGRARSTPAPYVANWGPHALYNDGALWAWLRARDLVPPCVNPAARHGLLYHWDGKLHRVPKPELITAIVRLCRATAPIERSFIDWASDRIGPDLAARLAAMAGVFTFDHDPGRLSAAFVHPRLRRATAIPSRARFVVGGWTSLVDRLAAHAQRLGVRVETGALIEEVPPAPVILAVPLDAARRLLNDESLRWHGAQTALLDVAFQGRRGDPYVVWDLDRAGWVETFTHADASLSPPGEHLLQAQTGLAVREGLDEGVARLDQLLEAAYPGIADRQTWRRRARTTDQSGALDLPGSTWRDRPGVDRGDGVYLIGDMVAAPGLLSEVTASSAIAAIDQLKAKSRSSRARAARPSS